MFAKYYTDIEVWQTDYIHQMKDTKAVADFEKPQHLFLIWNGLPIHSKQNLWKSYIMKLQKKYPKQANGMVLFLFRRMFFIVH
ncbi:MAG: hypothetical protein HFJ07_10290 [Lachnospiraceae bacterium]|nr:hypothetical protein [Lachnospiraceae bacterium]